MIYFSHALLLLSLCANVWATNMSITGDSRCTRSICVYAVVNDSNVDYILQSTGADPLGWMGIGFGHNMTDSAMVIMWVNTDDSITLSQRKTSTYAMPTVDPNPPRIANISKALSSTSGTKPQLAFTIAANLSDTGVEVIWAFGSRVPSSPAIDAVIQQHLASASGSATLDLSKTLTTNITSGASTASNTTASVSSTTTSTSSTSKTAATATSSSSSSGFSSILVQYQSLIFTHIVVCSMGFYFSL